MPQTASQRASRTKPAIPTPRAEAGLPAAYVETYGCQMNISDGELMEGILEDAGYRIVGTPEEADVLLVNTCAIRENAERRVIGRVGELNRLRDGRPEVVIGVTGCMAQRLKETLLDQAKHVDLVMGPDAYRALPETLADLIRTAPIRRTARRPRQLAVVELDAAENYTGLEQRRTSETSAWVPIQRGCDHRCTYCIVPYVRGPEKNRAALDILAEVRAIAEGGVTEVTLLGQTVNSYRAGEWDFPRLLRAVARVDGIRRVRFTSPHPNDVTPELIEVMATEPAVCEQLHLPVQSGSNRTLRRMLRRYSVDDLHRIIDAVRRAIPDIALSTDVIVAFPGESESEFEETLDLMRAARFDEAFTYRYSQREGTPATRFPADQFIDPVEGQARLEQLIEVSRAIQAEINQGEVGRVEEVLSERPARRPGQTMGRTRRGKVVAYTGDSRPGRYVQVRLTGTTGATFSGALLEHSTISS